MLGGTQQLTDSTFTSSRHTPSSWPLRPPLDTAVFTPNHGPAGPVSHGVAEASDRSIMEPDVIRMYSSSPPPMEDGAEEEDDEFGDFGTFSALPNSISFSEFDTPTTFNQNQALTATSPPEVQNGGGRGCFGHAPSNGLDGRPSERTETRKTLSSSLDLQADCNGEDAEVLTNGFVTFDLQGSPSSLNSVPSCLKGPSTEDGDSIPVPEDEFADFAAFSNSEGTLSQRRDAPPGTDVQDRDAPPGTDVQDRDAPPGTDVQDRDAPPEMNDPAGTDVQDRDAPPGTDVQDRDAPPGTDVQDRDAPPEMNDPAGTDVQDRDAPPEMNDPAGTDVQDRDAPPGTDDPAGTDVQDRDAPPGTDVQDRDAPPGTDVQDRDAPPEMNDPAGTDVQDRDGPPGTDDPAGTDVQDRDGPPGTDVQDRDGLVEMNDPAGTDVQDRDAPLGTAVHSQGPEDTVRDTHRAEAPAGSCNTDRGPDADCPSRDTSPGPPLSGCTNERLSLNGTDAEDEDESREAGGQSDEKSSETSFGRLLSTDALEEFGDMSTTGSVPSPPLQGDTATPAEDEEDFGDFGDAGSLGGQGFADFEQLEVQKDQNPLPGPAPEQEDDFGDFNCPAVLSGGRQDGGAFADFPTSDSFGNFSSAKDGEEDSGWSAFGEQNQNQNQEEGESWAAFSSVASGAPTAADSREEDWEDGPEAGRTEPQPGALSSRLEKLFASSFPTCSSQSRAGGERVETLEVLLEPGGEEERCRRSRSAPGGVWTQLQDVHEALGLRYQWGGSHCNKVLLCCLGIDTRNILFTGQKKQPVIVPMYAAGLGMLEPTKEPVKPVSAAEMIASIAQTPPAAAEQSSCGSDPVQEALPPIQFDWSSSGLTNPLDASGGSALLNLDFFGPVEDSGSSSSASIPGVDPELFELTTAKLDPSGAGSRVADAFARLMSTMEKTSTSTRKPRRDENLSEEASKVIAALPDLSFMQAKVLMFPATLTPLCSQATPD
ncbi:aftiphilin a [Anableps anableps]